MLDETTRGKVASMFETCPAELGELTLVCSRVHKLLGGNSEHIREVTELLWPKLREAQATRMTSTGLGDAIETMQAAGIGGMVEHVFRPVLALTTGKSLTAHEMEEVANVLHSVPSATSA